MNNVTEYINEFEEKLIDREKNLTAANKDFKDVNDLTALLTELDEIIDDLRNKYITSQKDLRKDSSNEELKKQVDANLKELDTFLKERALYEFEIVSTMRDYETKLSKFKLGESLNSKLEELKKLYHDRKDIITKMKLISEPLDENSSRFDPYDGVTFSLENADKFIDYQKSLQVIDDQILDLQNLLNDKLFDQKAEENIEISEFNTPILDGDLMNLFHQKEEILNELKVIENLPGPKVRFNFNKNAFEVPKSRRVSYINLLKQLKVVEANIEKRTHNELIVKLDENLLAKMEGPQRRAYLSSLLLQIENIPHGIVVDYIGGKLIPIEYKELYLKISKMLKAEKRLSENWSFALDVNALSKMTEEEKVSYYSDILTKLSQVPVTDPVNVLLDDETYIVNKKDESLLMKCYQGLSEAKQNLKQETLKLAQEQITTNDNVEPENNIDNSEKVQVTMENKLVSVLKTNVKQLAEKWAVVKSVKKTLENYKENILTKVSGVLMPSEESSLDADLDITIDEEYVASLTDDEKIIYYHALLDDIKNSKIEHEKTVQMDENTYKIDEKYEKLFNNIKKRISKLEKKKTLPVIVEKVKKANYLDKIKRQLKKKTVQIGLGLGTMFCVGFGLGRMSVKTSPTQNVGATFDTLDNNSHDDYVNDVVVKTIDEALENNENLESAATSSNALKDDTRMLDDNFQKANTPFGETFTLKDNAKIFSNYDSSIEYNPMFKNDIYTTTGVQLQLKDGSIVEINYNDPNAKAIVEDFIQNGAIIIARRAVANEGLQDYLQNGIDTGVFFEQSINLENTTSELQEIINDSLSQGRGL